MMKKTVFYVFHQPNSEKLVKYLLKFWMHLHSKTTFISILLIGQKIIKSLLDLGTASICGMLQIPKSQNFVNSQQISLQVLLGLQNKILLPLDVTLDLFKFGILNNNKLSEDSKDIK